MKSCKGRKKCGVWNPKLVSPCNSPFICCTFQKHCLYLWTCTLNPLPSVFQISYAWDTGKTQKQKKPEESDVFTLHSVSYDACRMSALFHTFCITVSRVILQEQEHICAVSHSRAQPGEMGKQQQHWLGQQFPLCVKGGVLLTESIISPHLCAPSGTSLLVT